MTQLAGIFWFDRRPIDDTTRRAAAAEFQAPRFQESAGFLLAWEGDAVIAEADQAFCCLDGRIDHVPPARSGSSALASYANAGPAGLGSLIGDWSLALYDEPARTLILASDYAGTRPLYYFESSECVAWSSSLEHLSRWMDCRRLNADYVAAFLDSGYPNSLTPYCGIRPVPAGSAVTACGGRVTVTEFWSAPAADSVRYADETVYEEQFRSLFQEAVAVRLESGTPAAAELSGGLDSSSIVCMADRLIRSGAVPASGLTTFSYFIPDSPDHRYIAVAEKACSTLTPVHLEGGRYPVLTPSTPGGSLPIWAEARLLEVRRRMRERGLDVLLTGQFGDLITGNVLDDSGQAADYFRRGELRSGLGEALAWSQSLRAPFYTLLGRALWNSVGWGAGALRGAAPSQRARLSGLVQFRRSRFFQCPDPLSGVLYSHPFTHRPLVEFLLAIPAGILCRPGEPRRLMRRGLKGIVPDPILRRRSKGNYEALFLQSLRPCAAELLNRSGDLWLARMGFVNRSRAAKALRKVSEGVPFEPGVQQVIRLEHWLRKSAGRGAIALPA